MNKIAADNASQLILLNRLGRGNITDTQVSPDKSILSIATTAGVYLYREKDRALLGTIPASIMPPNQFTPPIRPLVAFSPDGKVLAVAASSVTFWDVATRALKGNLPIGPVNFVPRGIEFSPDGKHVIVTNYSRPCGIVGGDVSLYNIDGYRVFDKVVCELSESGMSSYYRFTGDAKVYFFTNTGDLSFSGAIPDEVVVADLKTDTVVNTIRVDTERRFYDISPDGRLGAYSVGGKTEIVEMRTGKLMQSVTGKQEFTTQPDGSVAWQPVAMPTPDDATPSGCDTLCQSLEGSFPSTEDSFGFTFSESGEYFAYFGGNQVYVWNLRSGRRFTIDINPSFARFAFNADGTRFVLAESDWVATGANTLENTTYKLLTYDTSTGQQVGTISPTATGFRRMTAGTNPKTVFVLDSSGVSIWSIADGELIKTLAGSTTMAVSRTQDILAVASNSAINIVDPNNGEAVRAINTSYKHIDGLQFSSDGTKIAVEYWTSEDPSTNRVGFSAFSLSSGQKVYDTNAGNHPWIEFLSQQGYAIVHRDGGYLDLWDFDQGQPRQSFFGDWFETGVSYDGTIFASSDRDALELWETRSGKRIASLQYETLVGLSPDGKLLLTIGTDGTIHVWGVPVKP